MQTPDLIKLAPTLSAEERYKLIVSDFHRALMEEKELIAESERQAIITFNNNRAVWEEYTRNICMLQWENALWPRDIEAEKLRVFACSLLLSHALEKVLFHGDDHSISKEKRATQFESLKEYVAMFETQSMDFYAYPEAIKKIEQELYGVPIFHEEKKNRIASYYEAVDDLIEHHNKTIHTICGHKIIKKCINPMVRDMESYLVKKSIPDEKLIEKILDEVRHIAESETQMLGR
jgi:hypothetical protein